MRAQLRLAFVLFLLCTGCATFRDAAKTDRPGDGSLSLSDGDIRFARALAHYGQGLIYQSSFKGNSPDMAMDLAKAATNFCAAIEMDPDTPRLYPALAIAYLAMKENDKAIAVLEKACARYPENVQSLIDLAVACEKSGRTEEAITYFRHAIKLAPQMEGLYRELALIYFQQKKKHEALALLNDGIKRALPAGTIEIFCYNFGKLYESVGLEDHAVEFYKLAGTSKTPWPEPFIRIASIYMKSNMPGAIKTIDRALEAMPDEPKLLFLLGLMYSNDNQFEKAIAAFQKTEETVETSNKDKKQAKLNPVFYINFGSAYEKTNQHKKAEDVFRRCLDMYPDSDEVLNYLAYMWAERGEKLDEGLTYINKAIALSPDNGAYLDTLGWIYFKQKKYDLALEQIKKAAELIKNDPTIIEHLGDIYFAMNDRPKALAFWKRSFLIDQSSKTVTTKLEQNGLNPAQILKELKKETKANTPGQPAERKRD